MNVRNLLGRGREFLERMRVGAATSQSASSFGLLALRLERDLETDGRGRCLVVAATDDDTVGAESIMELAWCLAEELGRSVLIIDATFDLGALSRPLGHADKRGLAEILDFEHPDRAAFESCVKPTAHQRIAFMPLGDGSGGRVIRVEAVRELLAMAGSRYDFVLVQACLQPAESRSMTFVSLVDAALLIAVEEKTTIEQLQHGQRLLNDCGARRVALVLTSRPQARTPLVRRV